MPTQELYCYVDETGQDTLGRLFIVSVVVASDSRAVLTAHLERMERESGKGAVKWNRAKSDARVTYIRSVLNSSVFKDLLYYDVYPNTKEYQAKTILTIARAIFHVASDDHKATVFVDGLRRSEYRTFRIRLSSLGVHVKKVRGRKENSDALARLADSLCGFVRAALEGKRPFESLLATAEQQGLVRRN